MGSAGSANNAHVLGSQPPPLVLYGAGTPAGTLSPFKNAAKGSLYFQTDAATDDMAVWVKVATASAVADWRLMRGFNKPIVNVTASTLTVTALAHAGRLVTINAAAGCAVTLPASLGVGDEYEFLIGTTITSNSTTIKAANASDAYQGFQMVVSDNSAAVLGYIAVAGTDDTVSFNGTTTGGYVGDRVTVRDVAANKFQVEVQGKATGTEATCFSATVS